jgi:DNA-binding LacI/PurR family transcriptional regulator
VDLKRPAMTDVARLAGVSHQTVSRVLNDHPNVKEQTRLRVRAAMAELGYRPNKAAQALVTGRTQLIGVVAQNTTLYGPASLLAAFEQAAAEAGFAVSVGSVGRLDRESIAGAVERHLDQRVAGLVVIAPVASADAALAVIPAGVPLVTVDGDPRRARALVTVDQVAGAQAATRHLLDAGHRTVWHVSGPPDWYDAAGRVEGWRQTLEEAGAEVPPVLPADWTAAAGYRAGQMLARMPEVTAVFAANDHLALGILRALSERGRRVPQEVSVVGFDDVPEAAFFTPPLTTIRPDFAAVAHAGLGLLLAQMDSARPEPGNVNVSTGEPAVRWNGDAEAPESAARTTVDSAPERAGRVVLAPRLIVRDSVAPAT